MKDNCEYCKNMLHYEPIEKYGWCDMTCFVKSRTDMLIFGNHDYDIENYDESHNELKSILKKLYNLGPDAICFRDGCDNEILGEKSTMLGFCSQPCLYGWIIEPNYVS